MKAQQIVMPEAGRAELRDVDVPEPRSNEVQIRCVANGICMAEVAWFAGWEPPMSADGVGGHEGIGVVTKVGRDVARLTEGDWVHCGNWTSVQNMPGDAPSRFAKEPADPAICLAEPAVCVVIATPRYEIMPGDRALLIGAGYMGLLNVQMLARCPLAELVVCDVKQANLDLAREFGATEVIRADTPEGRARLDEFKQDPFDLVIEAAGVAETLRSVSELTRVGGRVSVFAWHHGPRTLDLGPWHLRGLKVLNTAPGIGSDYKFNYFDRAIRLLERGTIDMTKLVTHRFPVSDPREAMEISVAREGGYIKGVFLFEE